LRRELVTILKIKIGKDNYCHAFNDRNCSDRIDASESGYFLHYLCGFIYVLKDETMKTLMNVVIKGGLCISIALLMGCGLLIGGEYSSGSGGIDSQPIWGPTGYDHVEYYYLPDIEVYYNVPQHRFICWDGVRWISRSSLPSRYRGYDLYTSYKVVVNEREPYRNNQMYKEKYSSNRDRQVQQPIRDSRDTKYFVNKKHPEHKNWVKQQKQNKGKGNNK